VDEGLALRPQVPEPGLDEEQHPDQEQAEQDVRELGHLEQERV
jgi:hypothetical protein